MNKLWLMAGVVLSLTVVLSACGGGATPTPKPLATPTPTPPPAATPAPAPAPAAAGKELFTSLGCLGCHKINGEGGAVGPSLKGLAGSQRELANGQTVTADDNYIEESIKDPNAKVAKGFPLGIMLAFAQLTSDQINTLISFIKSLK